MVRRVIIPLAGEHKGPAPAAGRLGGTNEPARRRLTNPDRQRFLDATILWPAENKYRVHRAVRGRIVTSEAAQQEAIRPDRPNTTPRGRSRPEDVHPDICFVS